MVTQRAPNSTKMATVNVFRALLCLLNFSFNSFQSEPAVSSIVLSSESLRAAVENLKPSQLPISIAINEKSKRKTPTLINFHAGSRMIGEEELNLLEHHPTKVYSRLCRNLTHEVLIRSRVKLYSSSRHGVLSVLVSTQFVSTRSELLVRLFDHFQYAMFCLIVYMYFGDKLMENQSKEITRGQRRITLAFRSFNVFNFWPLLGKILFRRRSKEIIQTRLDQEKVMISLTRARLQAKQFPEENRKLDESEMVEVILKYAAGSAERRGLLAVADLAGLNMLALVNGHSGAALKYGFDKDFSNGSRYVVFYDMGTGNTYAALVYCSAYNAEELEGTVLYLPQNIAEDCKWRGKRQTGIRCARADWPLPTLKAKPTHDRKQYLVIYFPRTRNYSWADVLLVRPINEFPKPIVYKTHKVGMKMVKGSTPGHRFIMLNILEQLNREALVETSRDVMVLKDFAMESSRHKDCSDLGRMLLKLQNVIQQRCQASKWLHQSIQLGKQRCQDANRVECIEMMKEELADSIFGNEVNLLSSEAAQGDLGSDRKSWKNEVMKWFSISHPVCTAVIIDQPVNDNSLTVGQAFCAGMRDELSEYGGSLVLLILTDGIFFCQSAEVANVKPWAMGLRGQLQRAFITGVPELKRSEIEASRKEFSNVIGSVSACDVYKGALPPGVEIVVASITVLSAEKWPNSLKGQFRKKIDALSKVNHKNFGSLLGYRKGEEPSTRMMVFGYALNGTLFEHLHIRKAEHLDWPMRMRITVGIAYCFEHMHQLTPAFTHFNLKSSADYLTEDYAATISEFSFLDGKSVAVTKSGSNVMEVDQFIRDRKAVLVELKCNVVLYFLGVAQRANDYGKLILHLVSVTRPMHEARVSQGLKWLHLEDKVKVKGAGIDGPLIIKVYTRRNKGLRNRRSFPRVST